MVAFYRQRETKTEITLLKFDNASRIRKSDAAVTLLIAISFVAAGCGGNEAALGDPARGLKCVDDSNVCISQRKMVFDSYMSDPARAWVNHPAGPHEYASGVRLMAFSKKRKELNCNELARGKAEADRGPSALSGGGYVGLTTGQIARAAMLAREVSKELAQEMARRCR